MMRTGLVALLIAVLLIGAFYGLNSQRIEHDGVLRYDEATHVYEGLSIRDAVREKGVGEVVDIFRDQRVMKGILYRLYYSGALTMAAPPGKDPARRAGLVAFLVAALLVFLLARSVAAPETGDLAGALAVLFLVCSPLLNDWGRTAMVEPINLATLTLALLLVIRDGRRRTVGSGVAAFAALMIAFFTKYNHALILFGAVGLDALITALRARDASWRERLRPFIPLACASLLIGLWFLDEDRRRGFAYYIYTIPGGGDPVDVSGWTYAETLATRMAPWLLPTILLGLFFLVGLRGAGRPGMRLVVIHAVAGMVMTQLNDLKLERILVPLSGDLLTIAAVGGAALLHPLVRRRSGLAIPLVVIGLGLLFVLPAAGTGFLRVREDPMRQLDAVLDAGLDLSAGARNTLWLGQGFLDGNNRLTGPHVHIRAEERGHPLPRGAIEYGGAEFFGKNDIDEAAIREGLDDARLRRLVAEFDAIVVVHDPLPGRSLLIDPMARRFYKMVLALPEWELTEGARTLPVEGIEDDPTANRVRVELLRRVTAR